MPKEKGRLIVIDGADATGKKTQAQLLVSRLNDSGVLGSNKAHYIAFPNYEGPWGRIIKEIYLSGELGKLENVSPLASALFFAADRAAETQRLNGILDSGDWIILDRYTQSNFPYHGVRIEDTEKRDRFIDILQLIEFEYIGLPKPDKVLILDLSNEVRFKRSYERGNEDMHEKNRVYMTAVALEYLRLADKFGWRVVNCSPGGEQLSVQEISEEIWNSVVHIVGMESYQSVE